MKTEKKSMVFFILMLGIFMGAIDSGIVSPAREIIQNSLGTGATTGIWMITIYNLFYAFLSPISLVLSVTDTKFLHFPL